MPTNFVNVWAAGKFVLQGTPALAYDWTAQKAVQVAALGHPFDGYFGWHYPPAFLFLAMALAMLPYVAAFVFGTFVIYLFVAGKIVGERSGFFLAAGLPAVLANFIAGQNGFFSVALLGAALFMLVERPILAGVVFGILTYKPHLALLLPISLIAGGHWRALIVAAIVAALMILLKWGAFGTATLMASLGDLSHTSQAVLTNGVGDFAKMQTAFGVVRMLGGSEAQAWRCKARSR